MAYAACLQKITGGTIRPGGFAITDRGMSLCEKPAGEGMVLDAGCGTGESLRHLRERHNIKGCGVDLSTEMLAGARAEDASCPLTRARLEALPFKERVFGGVVCECVLCHTRCESVLEEFARVIRPGGFLVLSDLYRRAAAASSGLPGMEILDRERITGYLVRFGFDIVNWEDRTADLRRLAVELIMSDTMPPALCQAGARLSCADGPRLWRGVGYYLLVARRFDK